MSRLLIIDDDPDYSGMLQTQIERLGHEAHLATSLREGLAAASETPFDLVFLDVNLPDGSGLDILGPLSESLGAPDILIVTGHGDAEGAELAMRSGVWDYIGKSDCRDRLILSLRRALDYRAQKQAATPRALDLGGIVGKSAPMKACYDLVARAAACDANVLITGESGTGKELFARAIHQNSKRRHKNFVVVDCAALPEHLVESMLFGHRKGAFTGAVDNRVGLIEQADGGTLFLDEVAEMPLSVQKAFLRAVQEKRFRPIGADREQASDFRLISATNKDLERMAADATFRPDLLYRLRAIHLPLPALRERGDDRQEIAKEVLADICDREGLAAKRLSPEFLDTLARYPWPGNVRELLHALEGAVACAAAQPTLYPIHLPTEIRAAAARLRFRSATTAAAPAETCVRPPSAMPSLDDYRAEATRRYLTDLMVAAQADILRACELSGLSRSRLYALLKEHAVPRSPRASS